MYDGKKIQLARLEVGLSPRELAALAGTTDSTIKRVEKGMPAHVSTIRSLAKALGREVKDFIPDELLQKKGA